MSVITSRRHSVVSEVRAVMRGDDHRLLLDGWHLVADAAAANVPIELLAVTSTLTSGSAEHAALVDRLRARGTHVLDVSPDVMDALSPVKTSTGVVALAARPQPAPDALTLPPPALVVVAAGIQDPGNVGAVIRAAEAGGATGALVDGQSADPYGWKALRAGMGSTLRLPVRREDALTERFSEWRTAGLRLVTTDAHAGIDLYGADLTTPCAIVLGAEGAGIPQWMHEDADLRIRIPMRAPVESLNVAVAAALVVYEARRQRGRR